MGNYQVRETWMCVCLQGTVDPKSFDYEILATLDERGQGIPNDGDKRGGRKGQQCDQNYNLIER